MASDEQQHEALRTMLQDHLEDGATIESSTEAGGYDVDAKAVAEGGRFVCERLEVSRIEGGPPVTTEGLRELPVADLLADACRVHAFEAALAQQAQAHAMRVMDDAALDLVALAYRYGNAVGDAPTREVMRLCRLSRSKASRWIAAARERGYLGAALPRVAGEY